LAARESGRCHRTGPAERLRAILKQALERTLLATGVASLLGHAAPRGSLVLAYHNIVPHGEPPGGDRSLHLSQRDFATQLDILQREVDVVPLTELLEPATKGSRPRVAISFDDAYRGAVTVGVEVLRTRSLPATIFVPPAFLGGRSFWWDAAADPVSGLSQAARAHALETCAGQDDLVRAWAASTGLSLQAPPAHAVAASEEELQRALEYPGLTLGSHTWSHPNLTRLNDAELADELTRPLGWLRERFLRVIPWLTYPYGLTDGRVERAAERAGYEAALCVDGGWLGPSPSRYSLPRFNVPAGLSAAGFRLRLAGLFCR
jgi:peptidoglycan/xylan/chitin deacetylase (PgdA/CDA1 family)